MISEIFSCIVTKIGNDAVKNSFGLFSDDLFQLSVIYKSYRQVLTPVKKCSAPFKAVNSRQVCTCDSPFKGNTKKLQSQNWFINKSSHDIDS